MRLLFCVAAIASFARCTIDERPEDKNYVDEIVEEQGFDDLTIEEEPIDNEDSSDMPLLLPSPSFTPTSTTASTSVSQFPLNTSSVSNQLLMSPPDISIPTLSPLLGPPATSAMGPDTSVTIPPPSMRFMPDHLATKSPLVNIPDPSPQVLIPPPDELPEDVTETPPPTQSTTTMTTTSRPSYTILTVAIVPPITDMSNVMDTQKERANYTFDGMNVQQPAMTTMAPMPKFRTTLIDEVVTFKPPSDPPVFATLLHSMPTTTRRPRIVKLNDGEVKHRSSSKVRKANFVSRQKTRGQFKRKFYVEKAVKRLGGNRKIISRDVGPVGRSVPIPRGWRVTSIRRA